MRVRTFLITLGLFIIAMAATAHAQSETPMNPSAVLLLNQNQQNQGRTGTTAIDSGRYTPRAKAEVKPAPVRKPREPGDENPEPVTVVVPNGQQSTTVETSSGSSNQAPQPQQIVIRCDEMRPETRQEMQQPVQGNCPPPAVSAPVDLGKRLNLLELSVAPGYLYNNSESSYTFRNYTSATPIVLFDVNVWLNPGFGLHGSFNETLGGHVNDSIDGSRTAAATQEWFRVGLHGRKFFSYDSTTAVLNFGLDYLDYQFHVPADAQMHGGLQSSGIEFSVEAEIPASRTRWWTIGTTLSPKLKQSESATSINYQSGGSVDANAVSLSLGGRWQFDRNDALFWKLSHTVEKDLYSGAASLADPRTGVAPTGVAVINSFTIFQVGYTWGN